MSNDTMFIFIILLEFLFISSVVALNDSFHYVPDDRD